jgi:hypothetical protein
MLPGYPGGNSIALKLSDGVQAVRAAFFFCREHLLPLFHSSTHPSRRTIWSEAKKPLSDLGGAAQRDLGHGSMSTGRILYAVNSFFAGVLGIAGCTVSSTL